jgi:hypothetical protein
MTDREKIRATYIATLKVCIIMMENVLRALRKLRSLIEGEK